MSHRLLIVDDHPIVRRGLREMAENDPDLEVCGEAADLEEGAADGRRFSSRRGGDRPDPQKLPWAGLIEQIRERNKQVKMLVSSMHDDAHSTQSAALRCGASGLYQQAGTAGEDPAGYSRHSRGEICVSAKIADRLLRRLQADRTWRKIPSNGSPTANWRSLS